MPSPLTVRVSEKAMVVQLFGPKAVKLIVPPAAAPGVVGLMTGVPGSLAVPVNVAVSPIACPSWTGPDACVVSFGVTGVTVKHSVALLSEAFGTPVVVDVKSPRQQYRPTDVTVAAVETMGCGVALVTFCVAPMCVPPVLQVPVAIGPQRKKSTVPLHVETPVTVSVAESVTETEPVPIENALPDGVVTIWDPHWPKRPRTKSLSVASPDCEDRVLRRKLRKQAPPKPSPVRSRPPS